MSVWRTVVETVFRLYEKDAKTVMTSLLREGSIEKFTNVYRQP